MLVEQHNAVRRLEGGEQILSLGNLLLGLRQIAGVFCIGDILYCERHVAVHPPAVVLDAWRQIVMICFSYNE